MSQQDSDKDTSSHHESASQPGLVKLTKCVTIRNFEHENQSERQPLLPQNWLNCFNVTSQTRQALKKSSDWESADTSHLLLDIDLPNQQLYHLPLLITPVHCSYLITFDLRNHQESLDRIHNAMKNVFAHTQYKMKAGATKESDPKVLLVGMHADDEQADEKSFAHKLGQMLQRKPYNKLVHKPSKPGCDEPFWAVNGGDLSLSGTDPLSCAVQSTCSRHKSVVRQWIKCHKELRERLKDVPCIPYSNLREHVAGTESGVETSQFDAFLHFLHDYGFIFYHSIEEGQDSDKVVLLQPEYLCKLLAEVLKLKESRKRPTLADLTSSTAACMEATAKHSQWLQRICIDMGLVFEVVNAVNSISDYVFLMGLEPGPSCPSQEFYSVAPLLVTFKALGLDKQEEERLLPSYFFAAFITEFVRSLTEHNSGQNESKDQANLLEVVSMEQHYLQVCISNTYIHVVEREFCIEVGLQQVELPARKMSDKKRREMIVKKMRKMHSMCKDVRGVVVKSVKQLQERLKLAPAILYGFYHTRSAGDCGDGFAQYNPSRSDEVSYLRCRCCETPDHSTTPAQEIWFEKEEDFNFEELSIKPVKAPGVGMIRQLIQLSETPPDPSPSTASDDPPTELDKKVEASLPETPPDPSPSPAPDPPTELDKKVEASLPATEFSVSEFLKKHETEFIDVVNPKQNLFKLIRKGVITEGVKSDINSAESVEDAREVLYYHLAHHANVDTLKEYCKVAAAASGYPKMQSLGIKMKKELQQVQ